MERRLTRASEIGPGKAKPFTIDGMQILVCNVGGSYYAIDDLCTHDGGPLDLGMLEGYCAICPRHGATFDVRTGTATLPAVLPVATYPVTERDGELFIEI
jgi:3-phenylpropionate/trans-cinnamate dioxygenase ferredoxin component